jgi:hypothetical protein
LLGGNIPSWSVNHVGCADMFSDQLAFLRASFANEVISSTGIKENDVGVSV